MPSHPRVQDQESECRFTVADADAGQRLDRFLATALAPAVSRSRVKALLAEGHVALLTGTARQTIAEADRSVKPGEHYAVTQPAPPETELRAERLPLDILYEDNHLIVIEKPAGMVVHPAPGNWEGTLVNALLAHCGPAFGHVGSEKRPGIVHRLDKETSGVMVAAKSEAAYLGLVALFARHEIERAYEALVWGVPAPSSGTIDAAIGRHRADRKKMAVTGSGKRAVTHYRVTKAYGGEAALLECRLETGRTHQIRVHMASIGHPLIGDPTYARSGNTRWNRLAAAGVPDEVKMARQALHAKVLGFRHPVTGEDLYFERLSPSDMRALAGALAERLGQGPAGGPSRRIRATRGK
jgi:23S rRNA pseudouridine1911/1915/1917 synthase